MLQFHTHTLYHLYNYEVANLCLMDLVSTTVCMASYSYLYQITIGMYCYLNRSHLIDKKIQHPIHALPMTTLTKPI